MILTTKGRYAVMAMLDLAKHEGNLAITLANIAERQNIPLNYLEQIFARLKNAEIVSSVRGPGGGYKLKSKPDQIDIYSITSAVEEEIVITKCGNNKEKACLPNAVRCLAHHLWDGLEHKIIGYLQGITLADVLRDNDQHIYLDYNATAPMLPGVRQAMNKVWDSAMNPSSLHFHGRAAKGLVENAREKIAASLRVSAGRDGYNIIFTSSGTEANNLLFSNFQDKMVVVSEVEHLSVLEASKKNPNRVLIGVDKNGRIELEGLKKALEGASMLSIILANNETGVIQDIKAIVEYANSCGILVHSDCVQAFGKIPLNIEELGLDFATISAHKLGGPVGAAALVHRSKLGLMPQIVGGGQERGMRSGTENVAAIVGFGVAAELAGRSAAAYAEIADLRDEMEVMIKGICPSAIIFGSDTERLPNTSMLSMPGVETQTQLIYFDLNNISVSGGSACSSGKIKNSHVLKSMGYEGDEIASAIRVSLGAQTTRDHIVQFVNIWKNLWEKSNRKVA